MIIYAFCYTSCVYESAHAPVSLHKTKAGAYRAMKRFLFEQIENAYASQNAYGNRYWSKSPLDHCGWSIQEFEVED